jgi:hypothetical protein
MATRTLKKRRSLKKSGGFRNAPVLPSIATRFATELFGRLMQLICISGVVLGLVRFPNLIETVRQWFFNNAANHELARLWLTCALPLLLGATAFWYFEQSIRRFRRMDKSLIENPSEPWLAESRWKNGSIQMEERAIARGIGFSLVAFHLVIIPGISILQWEGTRILCLGGGLVSVLFVINRLRDGKFYASELKMQTLPGVVGGPLKATFVTQQKFPEGTTFEATLRCDYHVAGSEDTASSRETLWSDTNQVCMQLQRQPMTPTAVPLSFSIPFHLPSSAIVPQASDHYRDVRWTLSVQPRNSLSRTSSFWVPVFRTVNSRATYKANNALVEAYQPAIDDKTALESNGFMELPFDPNGSQWIFHHRERGIVRLSLVAIICSLALITACGLIIPRWTGLESARVVVPFVCFLPAGCLVAFCYTLLDALLWQCRIIARARTLEIQCGWKGFRRTYEIPRDETTSLSREIFLRKEVGELWNLFIEHPSLPQKINLLKRVESKKEAELIQEKLASKLKIRFEHD